MLKALMAKHGDSRRALKSIKERGGVRAVLREEGGAIDLASIMVGVIIVGVLSGIIAATVFAVIPWAQDNAAKQALDSVVTAQSTTYAMSAQNGAQTYKTEAALAGAGEGEIGLQESEALEIQLTGGGTGYVAFTKSSTGNVYFITNANSNPKEVLASAVGAFDWSSLGTGIVEPTFAPVTP